MDPHADLVDGILEQVPESLAKRVRLIDLADPRGAPGINLLDTRIFTDRDRTADSVVRVARGLWDQWGPRMQSILEFVVKTLHEANETLDADKQFTHSRWVEAAHQRSPAQRNPWKGDRPLHPGVVGQRLLRLEPRLQGRLPGTRPDPALLLLLVPKGKGHPGPVPLHH